MPDISMIWLLYHEKDISLRISALCQCNIQIVYPKPDIAAIYRYIFLHRPDIALIYERVIAYMMPDSSLISLLYHENDIHVSLRISALCQCNIQNPISET